MKKTVLCLVAIMVAVALLIAPSAAAIYSPNKISTFQISSQKSLLAGLNLNNPSSFESFFSTTTGMHYGPAPTPELNLPPYLGASVNAQNLFIPGACPGGCCGCCC